jgi:predicted membrane-bound mannosyltransferase
MQISYTNWLFTIIFLVKDKASVLAEVAKLQEIRDELTSEVASLHAQLEQERSKTRTSSTDVKASKQTVRIDMQFYRFFFKYSGYFTHCMFTVLSIFQNKKRPASENA